MVSDNDIIKLLSDEKTVRKGFELLVSQYSEKLYWQVRSIVVVHEDANDVVQNAFVKAWLNLDSFESRSKMSTWLSRIAINEALDYIRKRRKQDTLGADEELITENCLIADEWFDGDKTQAQLQEAIAKLPEVQRVVFSLRYYEDMKYSEISRILGTSEGALKASYHHAVKKIEDFFNAHD